MLDSLPEQSKEPFIFHQLGGGGGWWDMRGGGGKNLAFKGGVSDGFVKMQTAYQNAKNQRSWHSESSDFYGEACPQTPTCHVPKDNSTALQCKKA